MPKLSSETAFVHPECEITQSDFGRYVEIGKGSRVAHSTVGDYSYCDRYADIANATLGKFVNIASFTRIGPTDHPMHLASMHHFLYRSSYYWEDTPDDPEFFAQRLARRTTIGHDTWIGHGAIIRPEVTIGHGAVVAASAVVTRDVAPYEIVTGVPASPMRMRFSDLIIDRLMQLAWWDWEHDILRDRLQDFRTLPIEAFLEKYEA